MKKMRFYASEDSAAKVTFLVNKEPVGSIFTGAGVPDISLNTATTSPVSSIKLLYGTPGSGTTPIQITSSSTGTLNFTHNDLANLTTGYYYADIIETDGSRIITSPIWYNRDDSYVKKTQTITFAPERSATYGDPDLEIGASSDNPAIKLTYTSSDTNKATVTDGKIQLLKPGKVTITVNQKGDAYFSDATGQQILTIIPKSIFVKADAKQKLTGIADPVLTYTTTSTLVGTAAFTGNLTRDAGEIAGSYTINQGTLALDSNYLISYSPAALQIIERPSGNISGDIKTSVNAPSPVITFIAKTGTGPFTFTYQINDGAAQTLTTTGNTATLEAPTTTAGSFTYTLTKITDANSSEIQNVSTTVTVFPLPAATISGTKNVCLNSTDAAVIFTGANGTAPYTFTYNINGGNSLTATTTSGNSVSILAPASQPGKFVYNLMSVGDANTAQAQNSQATVTVNPLATASISGSASTSLNAVLPVITFTAANGSSIHLYLQYQRWNKSNNLCCYWFNSNNAGSD
ncbi:MBG domain-containing protein [Pedobacter sp. NJ-S-72]